jgi:glycerol uptake facilitator-like aquaporin
MADHLHNRRPREDTYDMEKHNRVDLHQSNSAPEPPPSDRPFSAPMAPYVPFDKLTTNSDAFLGRLGGGQRFALSPTASVDSSTPADALRDPPWSKILSPSDFRKPWLWKLACIEGFGTAIQVFLSGILGVAVIPTATETSVGPVFPVALASVVQIFIISLFIYATGPVTGAHFNPLITMGAFAARLTSLPRAVLYISHQCIGAVVGAYLVRAALGLRADALRVVPGCYIDSSVVTPAEAFTFESVMCFVQLFLAFGLGLDPRNVTAFGPSLAPILIGLSSAISLFICGFAREGYLGPSLNPARCLGLMTAGERFTYHWVHWVGPIMASTFNGVLYWLVPPYKKHSD